MNGAKVNDRNLGRMQTLPRLMLLVALTFGVLGLHTFCHQPDVGHGAHAMTAAHLTGAPGQGPDGSTDHDIGLHAFTVCLAVLGTVAVVVSLVMHGRRRLCLGLLAGADLRVTGRRRGPPRRRIGLHLTTLAVMRT